MSQTTINKLVRDEISRITEIYSVDTGVLEEFAYFVINNYKKKDKVSPKDSGKKKKVKSLTLAELKEAVYKYFKVSNTTALKRSGSFKDATDGMDDLNLAVKKTWERLYRKFVGILPGEENQRGYGCINGINIFDYFKPWQVFGLDPKAAKPEDIKKAYRELSKVYHPDVPSTGDAEVFDRINIMYQSISAGA